MSVAADPQAVLDAIKETEGAPPDAASDLAEATKSGAAPSDAPRDHAVLHPAGTAGPA